METLITVLIILWFIWVPALLYLFGLLFLFILTLLVVLSEGIELLVNRAVDKIF